MEYSYKRNVGRLMVKGVMCRMKMKHGFKWYEMIGYDPVMRKIPQSFNTMLEKERDGKVPPPQPIR